MSINPDPKRLAIRFRKGKPALFERSNLLAIKRWRKHRAKMLLNGLESPIASDNEVDRGIGAKTISNPFYDES